MFSILEIRDELQNLNKDEAFEIAARKLAEGETYAKSYEILYKGSELSYNVIRRAQQIQDEAADREMREAVKKLLESFSEENGNEDL